MKQKSAKKTIETPNPWGTSYIKIPRKVLDMSLSQRSSECNKGRLLTPLFSQVYFKDGFVQDGETSYICKRGSCIVNVSKQAALAAIKVHTGYIELSRTVYVICVIIIFNHLSSLIANRSFYGSPVKVVGTLYFSRENTPPIMHIFWIL